MIEHEDEVFLKHALTATKKIYPHICHFGACPMWGDNDTDFESDYLKKEILLCRDWLKNVPLRKTINPERSSYGYKHDVENWSGTYVCNGAFIIAAVGLGLKSEIDDGFDPNPVFNISKRIPKHLLMPRPILNLVS